MISLYHTFLKTIDDDVQTWSFRNKIRKNIILVSAFFWYLGTLGQFTDSGVTFDSFFENLRAKKTSLFLMSPQKFEVPEPWTNCLQTKGALVDIYKIFYCTWNGFVVFGFENEIFRYIMKMSAIIPRRRSEERERKCSVNHMEIDAGPLYVSIISTLTFILYGNHTVFDHFRPQFGLYTIRVVCSAPHSQLNRSIRINNDKEFAYLNRITSAFVWRLMVSILLLKKLLWKFVRKLRCLLITFKESNTQVDLCAFFTMFMFYATFFHFALFCYYVQFFLQFV